MSKNAFSSAAAELRMQVNKLRAFEEDDDGDTEQAIAALTPEAAIEVLKKATSRSGQHKIDIPVEAAPPSLESSQHNHR